MSEEERTILFKIVFSGKVSTKTKKLLDHILVEAVENNIQRRDYEMSITYTEELKI